MNYFQNQPAGPPDGEVDRQPDDTVSALAFSPKRLQADFIVSGTWSNTVSCYQVARTGLNGSWKGELKAQHQHQNAVLDVCWSDDCSKVFSASADKTVKMWDLQSNQQMPVAMHDAPIKTVHWIKASNYTCIMTTSWDKTIKFWDTRTQNPLTSISLPERSYCADVLGPMAVVSTADRAILVYKLDPSPSLIKQSDSPFKFQHRCVSIFTDDKREPTGFAMGSIEGRVAVQYIQQKDPKSNFTFKCHRASGQNNSTIHDIYAVNDIAFHPIYNTMATIGSDGKYTFWDKDARTQLKRSDQFEFPLTRCSINSTGEIFAFAMGYDWSKGYEYSQPHATKNKIMFHHCIDSFKSKNLRENKQ
jgi:mRNA export factor